MKHKEVAAEILEKMEEIANEQIAKEKVIEETAEVKQVEETKAIEETNLESEEKCGCGFVKCPFCCTVELPEPFRFAQGFANGKKGILLNTDRLKLVMKRCKRNCPGLGFVPVIQFRICGTIEYHCSAFPVVARSGFNVLARKTPDGPPMNCTNATQLIDGAWISSSCCKHIDILIKEIVCCSDNFNICGNKCPKYNFNMIRVKDYAVAENNCDSLDPICGSCGEEQKRIVKFRGCFVFPKNALNPCICPICKENNC